ncbi:hypothetical protein [Dyadobacter sp. 676]|uniref:Uncharacterized protein n=1 Tax=Dyadobacter sp. 676 TaxID=3088362 RepID=A0AAU8FLT2_9BACT
MKNITNKLLLAILVACSLLQCRQETGSPSPESGVHSNALPVTATEAEKLAFGELTSFYRTPVRLPTTIFP